MLDTCMHVGALVCSLATRWIGGLEGTAAAAAARAVVLWSCLAPLVRSLAGRAAPVRRVAPALLIVRPCPVACRVPWRLTTIPMLLLSSALTISTVSSSTRFMN